MAALLSSRVRTTRILQEFVCRTSQHANLTAAAAGVSVSARIDSASVLGCQSFFVNELNRYFDPSRTLAGRIRPSQVCPLVKGDKGSRVQSPHGSRHCVPAIVSLQTLNDHSSTGTGTAMRQCACAGSQETLPTVAVVSSQ